MTEDNDILTESTKTVECEICERLIILPDNFDPAKAMRAELEFDMFDIMTSIKAFQKGKGVICPVCMAKLVILQLQEFVRNEN